MNSQEIWQVEVQGHVYEADIEEIIEWINEGSVLAEDKVRKRSLRWIKAAKVPELYGYFHKNVFESNSTVSVNMTDAFESAFLAVSENDILTPDNSTPDTAIVDVQAKPISNEIHRTGTADQHLSHAPEASTGCCSNHPEIEARYFCGTCLTMFCKKCPENFGGTVKICSSCGGMCQLYAGEESRVKSVGAINKPYPRGELELNNLKREKFHFSDAVKSLIYPFKFKVSLIAGAVLFAIFIVGQTVSSFGVSMYFGAIICLMLANMLVFGCLANTVDNFSQGKTDKNFMPDFDDFNLWDDVIQPFFLTLAVYAVSFGLVFAFMCAAFWYVSDYENKIEQNKQKIISAVLPNAGNDQSADLRQIKQVSGDLIANQQNQPAAPTTADDLAAQLQKNAAQQSTELEKLQSSVRQSVQARVEQELNLNYAAEKSLFEKLSDLLRLSLVFSVPFFLALVWGAFYFPAACAVAAYTRSFKAALDPSIGLDTIRRIGLDYWKIVGIFVCLSISGFGLNAILQKLLVPLNIPFLGNLPATALLGLWLFYISIVFSVALGFLLDKNSDRLNFRQR